jgi:predicted MPP superfamily phosphohydrolase
MLNIDIDPKKPFHELVTRIFERNKYVVSNVTKIIHLSDLHIGYADCFDKAETIVRNIIKREKTEGTVVIITGDIVDKGASKEDLVAGLKLLAELRGNGFTVLLCPGNHDYGTGYLNSKKTAENFRKIYLPEVSGFPRLDVIGNVAFIGLDSTAGELEWYNRYFAEGKLGRVQRMALENIMDDPAIKNKIKVVYLHHHPIHFIPLMLLWDRLRLKKIIGGRVDILLFGHLHFGHTYHNTWGIPVVIDGGSSTGKKALELFPINIRHRIIHLADMSVTEGNFLQ